MLKFKYTYIYIHILTHFNTFYLFVYTQTICYMLWQYVAFRLPAYGASRQPLPLCELGGLALEPTTASKCIFWSSLCRQWRPYTGPNWKGPAAWLAGNMLDTISLRSAHIVSVSYWYQHSCILLERLGCRFVRKSLRRFNMIHAW